MQNSTGFIIKFFFEVKNQEKCYKFTSINLNINKLLLHKFVQSIGIKTLSFTSFSFAYVLLEKKENNNKRKQRRNQKINDSTFLVRSFSFGQ